MSIVSNGFDHASQTAALHAFGEGALASPSVGNAEPYSDSQISHHSGLPLVMAARFPQRVAMTPVRRVRLAIKRALDILLSGLALLGLLPLFMLVALAILCESRGPVIFRQYREGVHGRLFPAFKFRSMRVESCDASGLAHTRADDDRITRVGRFLRRTSIDELPQLLNVFLGHMSLVGPRPHVPNMQAGGQTYKDLVPYYDERLAMLPGLTGWAQANGYRGDASDPGLAKARIDHDMAYIQNFSLLLDLRIVLITLQREFLSGNGN